MSRRIFYYSLLSLSIAACSGNNARQASGDFEYANKQEAKQIVIPSDLKTPAAHDDFSIIAEDKVYGPVGQNVDVRAPSLVLPIAASSRPVTQSSESIIWFDKVLEDKDLKVFIVDAIKAQLTEDEVKLLSESDDSKLLTSDWYHKEKEKGVVFTEITLSESKKFAFEVDAKPHGRSVSVKVKLIDYMKTDQRGSTKQADPIDQQRAEMEMLNNITAQVDYQYRLQQRENRLLKATQKIVTIGENDKNEPSYIVDMESDLLWQNLPIFFERHGFEVTDLNEDKKVYYVNFVKPETSIWDAIWGDDVPVVEFENRKYQFLVSAQDEKSVVTIYDEDGFALTEEKLETVFTVMEAGLSFREL